MNLYEEGDPVDVTFTATDRFGNAVDPTTVYFGVTPPTGTEVIYSVAGGTITVVDSLTYTFRLQTTGLPGNWIGRSWSTNGGAKPWAMKVQATNVPMIPATPSNSATLAPYTVTTTNATPTRLARIPLAADKAVEIAISVFGVSGANAFERVGLAFYKRTGSAAPVLDTDAIAAGLTGVFGSSWGNAALTAATAAFAIDTDSIDINVTGIAATTIRWSLQTGAWFYV